MGVQMRTMGVEPSGWRGPSGGVRDRRGFSLVEAAVVLVLMAAVLMIATPGMIRWYNQQRFSQNVQRVLGSLRVAQFSAVSTGYWMLVAAHTDCPDSLQLRQFPQPLENIFCMQRFRLPIGQCSPSAADWGQLPDGLNACGPGTPPAQMCEYTQDFWMTEPRFAMEADIPSEDAALGGQPTTYMLFSPDGSVGYIQAGVAVPPANCTEMLAPIVMPLPGTPPALRQFRFGWPAGTPQVWQAVCLSGRGRLSLTLMAPTAADVDAQCP